MDVLIQQAPANLTIEEIEMVYNKNNNDMIKTLEELWGIIDTSVEQPKTKWDDIRETCDAYDSEMQKVMKRVKK
jgi:glutamyl-tRNA reductase